MAAFASGHFQETEHYHPTPIAYDIFLALVSAPITVGVVVGMWMMFGWS